MNERMNFQEFQTLVENCNQGKHLSSAFYIHESVLNFIPEKLALLTLNVSQALKTPKSAWNIVKFSKQDFIISLLYYPDFLEFPNPHLHKSYTIDLDKLSAREAYYQNSINPPILHRREAFLRQDHPQIAHFQKFTQEGQAINLYENTRTIGFKQT